MHGLTQQEISTQLGICERQVRREIRKYDLKPIRLQGYQPIFKASDVQRMKRDRDKKKLIKMGYLPRNGHAGRGRK
jgi:hypothetical protein